MATGDAVLGVHVGLNSSVALLRADDGALVYAEQEERLSRVKNHCGFPLRALRSAARHAVRAGLSIDRVGVGGTVVFPYDRSRVQLLDAYRRVSAAMLVGAEERPDPDREDEAQRYVRRRLGDVVVGNVPVEFYDHHTCHASAAYHLLRADDRPYLVVTLDGEGDGLAGTVSVGQGGHLERVAATDRRASAGLLYFWVTYLLGLTPHEDEHKVMGLAGYADPAESHALADELFAPLLDVDEDALALCVPTSSSVPWLRRLKARCERVRFDLLAGALQARVEQVAARLVGAGVAKTGVRDVVLSGGLFMNVKVNQAIRHHPAVASADAMPSAGDESLAVGAAYLACRDLAGVVPVADRPRLYLGGGLGPADMDNATRDAVSGGCRIVASGRSSVAEAAAAAVCRGEPVAVCVGRAEFGARALGHRSLLAHPARPDAVDRLNSAVKQRDFWMPFAPVMLDEHAGALLLDVEDPPARPRGSRWMTHAYEARRDERLRGAVHAGDWTCRPQILPSTCDEPVADVLRLVAETDDQPALVNTSLNVHGAPMARTAADAVEILLSTPLRYLLVGDRLIEAPGR